MTEPNVAITLDVDWAPDSCIDAAASTLIEAGVRATWFITHMSPATERLLEHADHFELGWHPNFFEGSSHGSDERSVLAHFSTLLPNARAVRTHGLLQSTRLLELMRRTTDLRVDSSILLRHQSHLAPHVVPLPAGEFVRVPFWWEDDVEMCARDPLWGVTASFNDRRPGLRVLNFHPIHIALDSSSMRPYESLKTRISNLQRVTAADISACRGDTVNGVSRGLGGTGRAFQEAVEWLSARGGGTTISQLAEPLLS